MDKTYVFALTHLGANHDFLMKVMNYNPKISCLCTNLSYVRKNTLFNFHWGILVDKLINQYKNVYCDFCLYNFNLACPDLYKICKFIYYVRRPEPTLSELVATEAYDIEGASEYYRFRLQRLAHLSAKTSGIFLTWDDVANESAFPLVEKYLSLKMPLNTRKEQLKRTYDVKIPESVLRKCERAYDKYIKKIKENTNEKQAYTKSN